MFKNAWFGRFARKQRIDDDALRKAIRRAGQGLIDADLGGGVIKQRIARRGQGKSGGFRTIVLYGQESRAFFVYGCPKAQRSDISDEEAAAFKRAARHMLSLSDEHLAAMIEKGQFSEVDDHG